MTLIVRFGRALAARSSLPVCELHQCDIQNDYTHFRSRKTGSIRHKGGCVSRDEVRSINGWDLAAAVVKADFLDPGRRTRVATLGVLLGLLEMIEWGSPELRLADGSARVLADFVGSDMAGRVGQGVTLLVMERPLGYSFADHYKRNPGTSGPDFIVQDASGNRARVESKGSFVPPPTSANAEPPEYKRILREGLAQAATAPARGTSKSFVVGTWLREACDPEGSLCAWVDPDDTTEEFDDDDPEQSVPRHNYAAWLAAMGQESAAHALRSGGRGELGLGRMMSKMVGEQEYAVTVLPDPAARWGDWPWGRSRGPGEPMCLVAGLPSPVMGTIAGWLADPKEASLPPEPRWREIATEQQATLEGAVLADGSLLAAVPMSMLRTLRPFEVQP